MNSRFLDDGKPAWSATYMPFGIGPRNCVGARFAEMEFKTVMSAVIRKFIIELHPAHVRYLVCLCEKYLLKNQSIWSMTKMTENLCQTTEYFFHIFVSDGAEDDDRKHSAEPDKQ